MDMKGFKFQRCKGFIIYGFAQAWILKFCPVYTYLKILKPAINQSSAFNNICMVLTKYLFSGLLLALNAISSSKALTHLSTTKNSLINFFPLLIRIFYETRYNQSYFPS
jgi:hypothetical protein